MNNFVLPKGLEVAHRILVAGAGGGYDVYAGLPVYARLRELGKQVYLANLSFADLRSTTARELTRSVFEVNSETQGADSYYPERTLATYLSARFAKPVSVYAMEQTGAKPIREGYQFLRRLLDLDAVVLVDGGTDILLRGDEANLGTPAEDAASLAAVYHMDVAIKILVCVGMGIDRFHGVCHANWLENVAALSAEGGLLGALALLKTMPEVNLYLDAVQDAEQRMGDRASIVNGSIASAIEGRFGDHHRSWRTRSSKLFISPLMSIMWAFDLDAVARQNLYLDALSETLTYRDVLLEIERFHATVDCRAVQDIPY